MSSAISTRAGQVLATALALLALGACAGAPPSAAGAAGPREQVARPLDEFPRYPAERIAGAVAVEARLYTDHDLIFGADLARDAHVLPIALRLGLAPGAAASARFAPDEARMRLYLPDGTVLASLPAASISTASRKFDQRVAARGHEACLLGDWGAAREGFVFFALEPADELRLDGGVLLHKRGAVVRRLLLSRALMGFEVEVDGRPVEVHVGVEVTVSPERR